MKAKTVAVIDDQLLFMYEIKSKLAAIGLEAQVFTPDGTTNLAEKVSQSGLVLINLGFNRGKSVELVKNLRKALPAAVPIAGYCGHTEKELIQAGLEAGAAAVVPNSQIALNLKKVISQFLPVE